MKRLSFLVMVIGLFCEVRSGHLRLSEALSLTSDTPRVSLRRASVILAAPSTDAYNVDAAHEESNKNSRTNTSVGGGVASGGLGPLVVRRDPPSCKFTDDMIPDELSVFLQMKCSFPNGPKNTQTEYCQCVAELNRKMTNRRDSTMASDVKANLERIVVQHQLEKWVKYYQLIVRGQDQLKRQQTGRRAEAFGVVDACLSDKLADPIATFMSNKPAGCSTEQVQRTQFALMKMGVNFSSLDSAKSSFANLLRKSAQSQARRGPGGRPIFNCLEPGEEVMLTHVNFESSNKQLAGNSKKPTFSQMVESLEKTLKIVRDREGQDLNLIKKNRGSTQTVYSLLDPVALSQNLRGEAQLSAEGIKPEDAPNFGVLSYALGSFPLFGQLVKSLADDERRRDIKGDPVEAFSDSQKAQNRKTLIAELERLIKLYKDLDAVNERKFNRRVSGSLELTAKFLKETRELANKADADQVADASQVMCQRFTEDFAKIACAPIADISSPSLIANLLSDDSVRSSAGLPDFKGCHSATVDYNASPECFYMQSAVCSTNNRLAERGMNINGSFEMLPDFNSPDYLMDEDSNQDKALRAACGEFSNWAINNYCKGKTGQALDECGNSREAIDAYVSAEPRSDLALVRKMLDEVKEDNPEIVSSYGGQYAEETAGVSVYSSEMSQTDFENLMSGGDLASSEALSSSGQDGDAADLTDKQVTSKTQQRNLPQVMDFKPYVVRAQAESNLKKSEADLRRVDEQMRSENDPAKRSELDKERARLEAEIAGFKAQIEESNKQIAEMRREFENRSQPTVAPEKKRKVAANDDDDDDEPTTRKRGRSTGSSGGGVVVSGDQRGGSAGGGTGGATAGSTGGSTASAGGGSTGSGPITSVMAAQQAIAKNDALLETVNGKAAQLTLTVDGQTVNVQQIFSLSVPADASPEEVQKLMVADPSKLVFNGDGYALVEVTRPGQAPAYFKVKKDDLSTVAVSDSNDIPKQVRRWSASYASFMERLKANRAPAGQPNQESP